MGLTSVPGWRQSSEKFYTHAKSPEVVASLFSLDLAHVASLASPTAAGYVGQSATVDLSSVTGGCYAEMC